MRGKGREEDRARMAEATQLAWLGQLRHEFKTICFQYRVQLRLPIFEISAGKKQLGCWVPEQRILRISRQLIATSSWSVVLMVLKHEMAHQLCSEFFGTPHAGHGKEFQKACQLLGLPAPYNHATGDLPEVLVEPSGDALTNEGRKVVQRVNKLLALAGSENEHEAALAMQRATELLHRHNLQMTNLDSSQACTRLTIKIEKKRMSSWQKAACRILTDYFFVEVIFSSLYDAQRQDSYKTIELLGRSENVPVAEHCYYFLLRQLEVLWEKNKQRFSGNIRTAKNSYYLGLLHGFSQKLAEQRAPIKKKENPQEREERRRMESTQALLPQEDRLVQNFVGFHFPRVQTRSVRSVCIHQQSYEEAVATGKNIVLHRSLAEKKTGDQTLFISC